MDLYQQHLIRNWCRHSVTNIKLSHLQIVLLLIGYRHAKSQNYYCIK